MAKRTKQGEAEPNPVDAAMSRKIEKKLFELLYKLETMASDAESLRAVTRQKIADGKMEKSGKKKGALQNADGYDYLPLSARTAADIAIKDRIAEKREDIARRMIELLERQQMSTLGLRQMIVVDGKSRTRTEFPILDEQPELEHEEALQANDLYIIIGANELPDKDQRLYSESSYAAKRKAFKVLKKISERYKDEFEQVRMKGPKIDGKEAYIYHENVLRLVARYMEEEALQKMLFPPRGTTSADKGSDIVKEWNRQKDDLLKDGSDLSEDLKEILKKLGFFDGHLEYTPDGARCKVPQVQQEQDGPER